MVTRTVFPTVPPRVDYDLTELGQSLRVPIEALGYWAYGNLDTIAAARLRFDKQSEHSKVVSLTKGIRRHVAGS